MDPLTAIPATLGQGGANLAPNGAQGDPTLASLLTEHKAALDDHETRLDAAEPLIAAGMTVQKRTVTIAKADVEGLAGGVKTFTKDLGAALPANAHLVGIESALGAGFTDGAAAAYTYEVGVKAGDVDAYRTSKSCALADAGDYPLGGTAGVLGYPCAGISGTAAVKLTSAVDLNTTTAGSLTVTLYYFVLA